MSDLSNALVHYAIEIANDNRYRYVNWDAGETNTGPYTLDCATYNSLTIYKAMGWNDFPNYIHGGIGYFWPHISESGFDIFLLVNGWHKQTYNAMLLTPGAIIITYENASAAHHSLMYLGNVNGTESLADANNYFGYGNNSINVRPWPTYDTSGFAYIYLPPDTPVPPIPGHTTAVSSPRSYRHIIRKRRDYKHVNN